MKLVIVDDNNFLVETIHMYLEDKGYDVVSFSSPHKALEHCLHHHFDLLITDLSMDGFDGIELADRLREEKPNARVLLISGHVDEEDENQKAVFARHFDGALSKPLLLEALLLTIQEILDEPVKVLPPKLITHNKQSKSQVNSTSI